jgi:hypothetical protein
VGLERLDDRLVLSTFTVSNLDDTGAGSLRQAITDANATSGADVIHFTVAGTITLTSAALPALTDTVDLDGTTAPGFAGAPVVEIDANGFGGLDFAPGSDGSALRSLGVVGASNDGVRLDSGNNTIVGNYLGVKLDGVTADGNAGDGLSIRSTSSGNVVGAATTVISASVISKASNLVSGNFGAGISLLGSQNNTIVANYIGTDVSGTRRLGNVGDGLVLQGSTARHNTIGGNTPFSNPTNAVPLSNLISANGGDGVRLTGGANNNTLSANLIGTDVTGNAALGNLGDGVAILDGSNDNQLVGTTQDQSPFIYANIIGGNLGNGLVVRDSNNVGVYANFFGLGLDNKTPLGNRLDGALIAGSSSNTIFGGVIPLGNVTSANGRNGVEVADTATGFTAFNSFSGVAAFQPYADLGNGGDGFLVTSTGGNNLIRTSVISSNRGHGVHIGGNATGVEVIDDIIGLNTDGQFPIPNLGDGVRIDGNASHNLIGASLRSFSVIPRNTISGNYGNGVSIVENAQANRVLNSVIGTDIRAGVAKPNGGAGVFLAGNADFNIIGSDSPDVRNVISGNVSSGVVMAAGASGNVVAGDFIGTDDTGLAPIPNGGAGVFIAEGSYNLVGGTIGTTRNIIAFNPGGGVVVASGVGNSILGNAIFSNVGPGIALRPGANGDQPAPALTRLQRGRAGSLLVGTLQGSPGAYYGLQFFANTTPGLVFPSGGVFLGTQIVQAGTNGLVNFSFAVPNAAGPLSYTATATSRVGNTSMFSNALPAGGSRR